MDFRSTAAMAEITAQIGQNLHDVNQNDTRQQTKRQKHLSRKQKDETEQLQNTGVSYPPRLPRHIEIQVRNRQSQAKTSGSVAGRCPRQNFFSPSVDYKMQMIIIGDRHVGKTCFLERYTDHRFQQESKSTVGIDFRMKTVTVAGQRVRLQIWDTAGQERFNSITTAYYRNARGIILIYDVTNPETYLNISKWLDLVHEYARNDAEVAIVGNKADLPDVQVNPLKARNFAEKWGYLFYETSAKESLNVETVFVNLVYKILKQIPQPHERNPRVRRRENPVTLEDDTEQNQRSKCC
ncbi:ras-related protein Rab-12-like isoform X2 [Clavelina lepadiformis]|uniref:ras-related protein Rab-12-like isoform X2 n=1 Tax=Clavelina lepadiformis TaxID=159417 RepID=UPI00404195E3